MGPAHNAAGAAETKTSTISLTNEHVAVEIDPTLGRVTRFHVRGRTIWEAKPLTVEPDAAPAWHNVGGEWLWPVAQSRWASWNGSDWPPPAVLADAPWTVKTGQTPDIGQACSLSRTYGEPLNLDVERTITVEPGRQGFTILQTVTRTSPSDVPVTFWNIAQIPDAEWAALPSNSLRPMMFTVPGTNFLSICGDTAVYRAGGGEHKLCSASTEPRVAAARDNVMVRMHLSGKMTGAFPDGGCSVEVYANAGLGYVEIETLSTERVLRPGESMTVRLVFEAIATPDPCKALD